jgi:lactate dehydrogenase-like 2-hydroxyacid dehydrogenase
MVITGHQAFPAKEALEHIAQTTIDNIVEFATTGTCRNQREPESLMSVGPVQRDIPA